MRRSVRRGFTLLEAVVTLILLGLVTTVVFSLLTWGFTHFRLSIDRQGLQGDARRMLARLEKDLRQSNWDGLSFSLARTTTARGAAVNRHAVCLPTVSNWADPANYDPTNGLALADRYVVYYATLELPVGKLVRVEVDPGTSAVGPWQGFSDGFLTDALPEGPQIVTASILAQTVLDFTLEPDADERTVELSARLFVRTKGPGGSRDESLQVELEVHPENSLQ